MKTFSLLALGVVFTGCAWFRPPEPRGFVGPGGDFQYGSGDYLQGHGRASGENVPVSPNWSDYRPRGSR